MATMGTVLDGLRAEIVTRIYALTPEVLPAQLWDVHEPTDAEPFEEQAGHTRRFKVGWWTISRYTFGATTRRYEVAGELRIHYGRTDEERTAAMADADAIARTLIGSTPAATGVDYYCVPADGQPSIEDTGDGDGVLVSIPLFAVVETTA